MNEGIAGVKIRRKDGMLEETLPPRGHLRGGLFFGFSWGLGSRIRDDMWKERRTKGAMKGRHVGFINSEIRNSYAPLPPSLSPSPIPPFPSPVLPSSLHSAPPHSLDGEGGSDLAGYRKGAMVEGEGRKMRIG